MKCLHPFAVNLDKLDGFYNGDFKKFIGEYTDKDGNKVFRDRVPNVIYVGCGKCPECLRARQNNWFVRFYLEHKFHKEICPQNITLFVTFTYDDDHLPKDRDRALNDVRAFIKRFYRDAMERPRYYIVSENGDLHGRFHFHGLFFGCDAACMEWYQKFFEKAWSKGFICCEVASFERFHYIAKYVTKDCDPYKELSQEDNYQFSGIQSYSKRPALGSLSLDKYRNYLNSDCEHHCLRIDGFRYSLPRYLGKKVYTPANQNKRSRHVCDDIFDRPTEQEVKDKELSYKKKRQRAIREKLKNYASR